LKRNWNLFTIEKGRRGPNWTNWHENRHASNVVNQPSVGIKNKPEIGSGEIIKNYTDSDWRVGTDSFPVERLKSHSGSLESHLTPRRIPRGIFYHCGARRDYLLVRSTTRHSLHLRSIIALMALE
jgi:hypothetical protein